MSEAPKVSSKKMREDLTFILDNTKVVIQRFAALQSKVLKADMDKIRKMVNEQNNKT